MKPRSHHPRQGFTKRLAAIVLLAIAISGCGGGGGGDGPTMEGTREARTISSSITGTAYSLNIYLPPASAGPRASLPVFYLLDGESWFETLLGIAESTHARIIIVGIHTAGQRSRDFVPANSCTPNGGGEGAYLDFIRQELIPLVEGTIGGHPKQRVLFGHSHGGSFVLYAMFSEPPGQHSFRAYLASDSSVSCMFSAAYGWEQAYGSAHRDLPVRLHLSYATQGNYAPNLEFANVLTQRNYGLLAFASQAYPGSHSGIVPQVLADAVVYALAGTP